MGERGFSLIEVVVSLALLGIIGVGFLSILATVSKVTFTTDERQTASNLAETQMEYVKSQGYATSYEPAPIPPEYASYIVSIDASSLQDSNIQKITVTVRHQNKVPARLEGYKVR
jgi:prepilin-type N-terminal cleavage/methylation domain-containing protein